MKGTNRGRYYLVHILRQITNFIVNKDIFGNKFCNNILIYVFVISRCKSREHYTCKIIIVCMKGG